MSRPRHLDGWLVLAWVCFVAAAALAVVTVGLLVTAVLGE